MSLAILGVGGWQGGRYELKRKRAHPSIEAWINDSPSLGERARACRRRNKKGPNRPGRCSSVNGNFSPGECEAPAERQVSVWLTVGRAGRISSECSAAKGAIDLEPNHPDHQAGVEAGRVDEKRVLETVAAPPETLGGLFHLRRELLPKE